MIEQLARDKQRRRSTLISRRRSSYGSGREGSRRRGERRSEPRKSVPKPPEGVHSSELMYDEAQELYHNDIGWWDNDGIFNPYDQIDSEEELDEDGYPMSMPQAPPPPPPAPPPLPPAWPDTASPCLWSFTHVTVSWMFPNVTASEFVSNVKLCIRSVWSGYLSPGGFDTNRTIWMKSHSAQSRVWL
jgi:hypothetical protein